MKGWHLSIGAAVAVACALAAAAPPAEAAKIGVTAAVQNQVMGLQGSSSESLAAGSQVFQDEVIKTGTKSMAQLLFLDQTSLSVGPQSQVTLDKFVYNPSTNAGSVVLSTTAGAFRFITGTQPSVNYKINAALATIGVRGTIVDFYRSAAGLYVVAQQGNAAGAVTVTVGGKTYVLLPGQALFVAPDKTVTGPMTPDDQFIKIAGVVPFPLYGSTLPGEYDQIDVPDGQDVRADDLFEHTPPDTGDDECTRCPWLCESN